MNTNLTNTTLPLGPEPYKMRLHPGGPAATDSTLAPPGVLETDPRTVHVPSLLRLHLIEAQLPVGCNPYGVVSVGGNSARTKQMLCSEDPRLSMSGVAAFNEQFIIEYDPRASKDIVASVAFYERSTNALLGEWQAPISEIVHPESAWSRLLRRHDNTFRSWEHLEGIQVPLISRGTTTTATNTGVPVSMASGEPSAGFLHMRVRREVKLLGNVNLTLKEVRLPQGNAGGPVRLNVKFDAPSQKFTTGDVVGDSLGRFIFNTHEIPLVVTRENNVRDIFVEVIQNGRIVGETRIPLYDTYISGALSAPQPIVTHETKTLIGEMIVSATFHGKVLKR
jgi:hypothetical protein